MTNRIMVLVPANFLSSIHLRLNTDEKARILMTLEVMYWDSLPTNPLATSEMMIAVLFIGIKIYKGPSFCHDIKMKLFVWDSFLVTSMNHLWRGTAPSFIRIARIIRVYANWESSGAFTMSITITKAEAAD